jgi:hypothetical protein
MSIRQILKTRKILCIVPILKRAVKACFEGEISPRPGIRLATHPNTTVYGHQFRSSLAFQTLSSFSAR